MQLLNFDLCETNDMLRDQVSNFVASEITPIAAKTDSDNEFPNELWPKLGEMGLLGMTVPEEFGGTN
ncbi:acyl-CoA dehydrogenase family protein, partial [Oleiphilus sp. HI0043]|uniref:acyl-CoA dehydrogenase family protein n=3 Tax=unclassified Oleiphilus TaxID=2631174 RepID=UPI000A751B83